MWHETFGSDREATRDISIDASLVEYGQDTPDSLRYGTYGTAADVIDMGITDAIASVGIIGGAMSGGTIAGFAEVANGGAKFVTGPVGTAGWVFTLASDVLSDRTSWELQEGHLTLYIGTNSIVSTITWLGGDVNPELYTNSIADTGQVLWDIARTEGKGPDSVKIDLGIIEKSSEKDEENKEIQKPLHEYKD
jgi:hypothetical protein